MKKLLNYQKAILIGSMLLFLGSICELLSIIEYNIMLNIVFGITIILYFIVMLCAFILRRKEKPEKSYKDLSFRNAPIVLKIMVLGSIIIALTITGILIIFMVQVS